MHAMVTGNISAFHNANKHVFFFTAIYEFPAVVKIHVLLVHNYQWTWRHTPEDLIFMVILV